jgi:hypothetical protein
MSLRRPAATLPRLAVMAVTPAQPTKATVAPQQVAIAVPLDVAASVEIEAVAHAVKQ